MRHIVTCLALTALAIMAPRYAMAGDVEIAQQIAAQLRAQKDAQQLKGFHIGVKVEKGKVWMKGQVSDARQQTLALDVARRISGVTMVVNELHVAAPKPTGATATVSSPAAATIAMPAAQSVPLMAPVVAPTLRQPASTLAPATMPTPSPAIAANYSVVATTPQAPPIVQPTLTQPMVTAQAQLPLPTAPAAPVYTTATPVALSSPAVTGSGLARAAVTRSAVPSLQAGPPIVTDPAHGPTTIVQPERTTTTVRTVASSTPQTSHRAPRPIARMAANIQPSAPAEMMVQPAATPVAHHGMSVGGGVPAAVYDHPSTPSYAWPSYAAYPNYAGVTYPRQYSPTAWPYIGPFYPYPQVPLGWRKVTLEWDDGWWFLDFKSK